MGFNRPQTSGSRRRPEPLSAKYSPQESETDTVTDTDVETARYNRPRTASLKSVPLSRPKTASDIRNDESDSETDSSTLKAISRSPSCVKFTPPRSSSGVRSKKGYDDYNSGYDTTGTETDTETLKAFSLITPPAIPEQIEDSNDYGDDEYSPDFESDDDPEVDDSPKEQHPVPPMVFSSAQSLNSGREYSSSHDSEDDAVTVISVAPKKHYPTPATPLTCSDVRSLEGYGDYTSSHDSDDAQTVVSIPTKMKSSLSSGRSSGVETAKFSTIGTSTVPYYDSDEERSVAYARRSSKKFRAAHTEEISKVATSTYSDSDEFIDVETVAPVPTKTKSRRSSRESSAARTKGFFEDGRSGPGTKVKPQRSSKGSSSARTKEFLKNETTTCEDYDDTRSVACVPTTRKSRRSSKKSSGAHTEEFLQNEKTKMSNYDSDGTQTVASIPTKVKSRYSSKNYTEEYLQNETMSNYDSDGTQTVASNQFGAAGTKELLEDEISTKPYLDPVDDTRSVACVPTRVKSHRSSRGSSAVHTEEYSQNETTTMSNCDSDGTQTVASIPTKVKSRHWSKKLAPPTKEFLGDETSARPYLDPIDDTRSVACVPTKVKSRRSSRGSSAVHTEKYLQDDTTTMSNYDSDVAQTVASNQFGAAGTKEFLEDETSTKPYLDPVDTPSEACVPIKVKSRRSSKGSSGANAEEFLQNDATTMPYYDSDEAQPVASIPIKVKPYQPSRKSTERYLEGEKPIVPQLDLDDLQSVESVPASVKSGPLSREFSDVDIKKYSNNETPVPHLDLDLESIGGKSSVALQSIRGYTDLNLPDFRSRDSKGSRLGEQLRKIDSKNRIFFPSSHLTRPSIEQIYGPVKKRGSSLDRHDPKLLVSSVASRLSIDKTRTPKTTLTGDTPRPPVEKDTADTPSNSTTNKAEPKILAPLLGKGDTDKKISKNRATPMKPKPFTPCGKGIPALESLPKPQIGKIPAYILKKKNDMAAAGSSDNLEIKPAIPSAKLNNTQTTDNLFLRNRIPLRKPPKPTPPKPKPRPTLSGSRTTDDLLASKKKSLIGPGSKSTSCLVLKSCLKKEPQEDDPKKPKKNVNFVQEERVRYFTEIPEGAPPSIYTDDERRENLDLFEKPPVFDEGPLPETEPSKFYLSLQKMDIKYSSFSPKTPRHGEPKVPYNYIEDYADAFGGNLERAAVHLKFASECTCEEIEEGADGYCTKHVNKNNLQYFTEVSRIMSLLTSIEYEVPEYDEAEEYIRENYPNVYQGWVLKKPRRLCMNYRVREAKCKHELVEACERVLVEEDNLAEYLQMREEVGHRRPISLSLLMKDVEESFEYSYTFLLLEYPGLFIQLVEKSEFMKLALERAMVAKNRNDVVDKAGLSEEVMEEVDERFRAHLAEL